MADFKAIRDRYQTAMAQPSEDVSMKLARLIAGIGSKPKAPTPFADLPPGSMAGTPAYAQPFTGLRNEPAPPAAAGPAPLPAPELQPTGAMMPSHGLPAFNPGAMPAAPGPQPMPAPAMVPPAGMPSAGDPAAPPMPAPVQVGPQAAAAPAYDPNKDPRYLPDQWRGAFNNWQWPS